MDALSRAAAALRVTEAERRLAAVSSAGVLAGCLLTIIGAKVWLISKYGGPTPFWDQWGAEGAALYKPYLDGTLRVGSLFDAHNEHRILFTRLLCLGLFSLERRWDPLLEMVVNAGLHVAAIGVLLAALTRALSVQPVAAVAVFTAVFLAIPFGWENTISGFQSEFYLYLLFVFLAVWLHAPSPAWSPRWTCASACAVASFFNLSSGALTPLVLCAVAMLQIVLGGRKGGYREWAAMAAQCAAALGMTALIPTYAANQPIMAHSPAQFVSSFLWAAAWPLPPALAVALHAPMVALAASLIRERPPLRDGRWIYLGLWIWLGLQFVALAYGRADSIASPRYLDIFLVGLILNFAALGALLPDKPRRSLRSLAGAGLAGVWLLAVGVGAEHVAIRDTVPALAEKHRLNAIETRNVRGYLTTGNFDFLDRKGRLEIPFPDANALRIALDTPEIRAILPPTLSGGGVPARRSVVGARDLLLSQAPFLLGAGIALLFFGAVFSQMHPMQVRKGCKAQKL